MKTRWDEPGGRFGRSGRRWGGVAALAVAIAAVGPASAWAAFSNKGNDFLVGHPPKRGSYNVLASFASDVATTVTVEWPAISPTFTQNVAVNPGTVSTINLPDGVGDDWVAAPGTVVDNVIHAYAADDFVMYWSDQGSASGDAALALPTASMGTDHIITTYKGTETQFDPDPNVAHFVVVAGANATTVTITPTKDLVGGYTAGVPFNVVLNAREGFYGKCAYTPGDGPNDLDLTGTIISADKPVGVTMGNNGARVPSGFGVEVGFSDQIFETSHPVSTWGTEVLGVNLSNRSLGSIYRIVAANNSTTVKQDGVVIGVINRGQVIETAELTGSHVFSADKAIWVTEYMTGEQAGPGGAYPNGDPAMVNLIPPAQFLTDYTFAPVLGFDERWVTIIANNADVGSLLFDGVAIGAGSYTAIPGSSYSFTRVALANGISHTTSSTNGHGLIVETYGFRQSTLYPGGAKIEDINPVCGDGNLDPAEQCDDGNLVNGDGCDENCEIEQVGKCGDGILDPGEQCDDGNLVNGDGCDDHCRTECGLGNEVLVHDYSGKILPGSALPTAVAAAGFTPVLVDNVTWSSMTTTDFAQYRAIVIGGSDHVCVGPDATPTATRATWSPAVTGNIVVLTAPEQYASDGNAVYQTLLSQAIGYAAGNPTKTGLYYSSGCTGFDLASTFPATVTGLDWLGTFEAFHYYQINPSPPPFNYVFCPSFSHIVNPTGTGSPVMAGLTDAGLATAYNALACNANLLMSFKTWPAGFDVLAINNYGNPGVIIPDFTGPDGFSGQPFILARGSTPGDCCGNGIVDPGETCDDGNTVPGDGCDEFCQVEQGACGDGVVDPGEQCDDGNGIDNDCCTNACTEVACGDGIVFNVACAAPSSPPFEECDDGNNVPGDGCDEFCQLEVVDTCGDGVIDVGEECDDGNASNNDYCVDGCLCAECGDGYVYNNPFPPSTCRQLQIIETCDDGNLIPGDGCDATCQIEGGICGDGVLDPGEQCDDGNTVPGDGCDGKCQLEEGIECCVDQDGDGWAAIAFVTDPAICVALLPAAPKNTQFGPCGPGGAPVALDCEDNDPAINPGVPEIPGNAVDENCNYSSFCGTVDDDSAGTWTWALAMVPLLLTFVLRRRVARRHVD